MDAIGQLGADTFLNLLSVQLQYQDPLQPMDSMQFVTQLAQFTQVEKSVNMDKTLGTLTQYMASMNNYNAAGLIGKDVQVEGEELSSAGGYPRDIELSIGRGCQGGDDSNLG
ncbi:MAG: hypothetical protein MPW16_18950 [Candidatus Manganitrophus sp.]|nr:MAG: hypothetical protein MPW16_18950 [Candidatus Manganitrophus sp.]